MKRVKISTLVKMVGTLNGLLGNPEGDKPGALALDRSSTSARGHRVVEMMDHRGYRTLFGNTRYTAPVLMAAISYAITAVQMAQSLRQNDDGNTLMPVTFIWRHRTHLRLAVYRWLRINRVQYTTLEACLDAWHWHFGHVDSHASHQERVRLEAEIANARKDEDGDGYNTLFTWRQAEVMLRRWHCATDADLYADEDLNTR